MNVADEVFDIFQSRGQEAYFGESVSILEHSLQAACLAREAGVSDSLIAAALLHDIGHLLHGLPEDIATHGVDGRHEIAGDAWLRSRFGPAVTEPVRLHVDAKRYLCRVDPKYLGELSPTSLRSLELQGGPHTEAESREFESNPYFKDAVTLRRWDDAAKTPELKVPEVAAYRELLRRCEISREITRSAL